MICWRLKSVNLPAVIRYQIILSYFGKPFHGWQRQPISDTVQERLEDALSTLCQCKIDVVGCGRTDTGVHASFYVAHTDLPDSWNTEQLVFKLNTMLPNAIAIHQIVQTNNQFHARFDAIKRSYVYRIHSKKSAFLYDRSYYLRHPLDLDAMNDACNYFLGDLDFSSFCKSNTDVLNYNCEVFQASWKQVPDELIFEVSANRFLRNMVRAMVGTLLEVGQGKRPAEWVEEVLEAKNRSAAGTSVPAHGLYLSQVSYPEVNNG